MDCPSCGSTLTLDAKFCATCGAPVPAAEAAAERRKLVTVLFADIAGSTAMGEALDPEAIRSLLARHFAAIRAVIERHGGTVEKFIGDAVMAVFGIPQTHEDDALRALRAALGLQEAIAALNAGGGAAQVEMRAGINTGEVVTGEGGSGETLVTGDTVNTAARLEQAAELGTVLIGASTYRLVTDAVVAEPVAPLTLKGKAEPVPAYRVTALRGDEGRRRHLEARLVGRADEMATLRRAWQQVRADPAPILVTVVAPAGVGKSRLVRELVGEVEAAGTVLFSRCLPYGDGITYWPIRGLMLAAAGVDETDAVDIARDKVGVLLSGAADSEKLADLVSGAIGLAEVAAPQDELFWAIRRGLEHIAAEPTLIVVEDLHWAEPTLLDLLQYVVDLGSAPMLVLATARAELLETRPEWAAMGERASLLRLEALATVDSDELLASQAGGAAVPDGLRRRILGAAEGNPLFIEEMVAMLREDGLLAQREGGWEAVGTGLDGVDVPSSIRALLAARLDRLPREQRTVAERASVVGRAFESAAISELTPSSLRSELGRHLLALVRKELLRPDRADLTPGDAFRFRHILIRDAAYEMLPKAERASLHEQFARWLEQEAGDRLMEFEEILGYHLEQASRYRRELGEMAEAARLETQAGHRFMAAGLRAHRRGDNLAVVPLLTKAADILEGQARLDSMLALATALGGSGERSRALRLLETALDEARARGDRLTELRARISFLYLEAGEPGYAGDELRSELEAAIDELGPDGPDDALSAAWLTVGHLSPLNSDAERHAFERSLSHAIRASDIRVASAATGSLASVLQHGSTPTEDGLARIEEYRGRGIGHRREQAALDAAKAGILAMRGRFDEARKLLTGALETCHEMRLISWEIWFRAELADVELLADNPQAAAAAVRPSKELVKDAGVERLSLTAKLVSILAANGRDRAALALADELLAEGGIDADTMHQVLVGRARALHGLGDLDGAMVSIEKAIRALEESQELADLGLAYLDRARIRRGLDDEHWHEDIDRARDAFQRKGHLVGLERVGALEAERQSLAT
jgi:class 3 adenylate cyclase/tetratricopeptide (TPR) repeat protein